MHNDSDYLKALVGWTIVGVQPANPDDPFSAPALLLRKGKKHKGAFVLRDPEGNGPGHLDIVEAK